MQLRSPTASKGNQLALSGGNYDNFDNFRLFGMAGSGQDTGETLGYKRRDLSAQVQKKRTKIYSTKEQGEGWKRKPRHLSIFKILPNKVHNEFNSVPYGPEECSG